MSRETFCGVDASVAADLSRLAAAVAGLRALVAQARSEGNERLADRADREARKIGKLLLRYSQRVGAPQRGDPLDA